MAEVRDVLRLIARLRTPSASALAGLRVAERATSRFGRLCELDGRGAVGVAAEARVPEPELHARPPAIQPYQR